MNKMPQAMSARERNRTATSIENRLWMDFWQIAI